jgi:UDP-glucose 4-epimerase
MESENYGILGQIFNVGTGINHSVLEIAQLIGDDFTNLPPRPGESRETLADITKISRELGYEPSVKLEDWIKENK